jgi:lactate permease
LLKFRWKAPRAGLVSWLLALVAGYLVFGGPPHLLYLASLKGLSLTLFVVLIIWSSVLLYNVVDRLGGIAAVKERLGGLIEDELLCCLLTAWCLSGMVQGIAGFGVPVAIVAPLMVAMGFDPLVAAAATLVGHAWSISFGSMAASFYTIQLVTRLDPSQLASWMGMQFAVPTILSGYAVAHIYGGLAAVRRGALVILLTGSLMALVQWAAAVYGLPQVAAFLAGLAGALAIAAVAKRRSSQGPVPAGEGILAAAFPYLFLIGLIALSQVPAIKTALKPFRLAASYPEMVTNHGFVVLAEANYAAIGIFSHPAPLILFTILVTWLLLSLRGRWPRETLACSLAKTRSQCTSATLSIATMVMMALVMNDTGMTTTLARGLAGAGERFFPVISPYVGVLGCFMTGSNTNSNVLFGKLQVETAMALGINPFIIAALQSVGGSLGSSIAPAKVLVGSATVGLTGKEHVLLKTTLGYCLAIVFMAGAVAWVLVNVVSP